MALRVLLASYLVLGSIALAASNGGYTYDAKGFYGGASGGGGHFDEAPQLQGCFNGGPGRIFRGGQPLVSLNSAGTALTDAAVGTLKRNGVTLVINLRVEASALRRDEQAVLARAGIRMMHFPMTTSWPNSSHSYPQGWIDQGAAAVQAIHDALLRGENVFIHCLHGEDRTGIFIAMLRRWEGAECPQSKREFRVYGGTLYEPLQVAYDQILKKHFGR